MLRILPAADAAKACQSLARQAYATVTGTDARAVGALTAAGLQQALDSSVLGKVINNPQFDSLAATAEGQANVADYCGLLLHVAKLPAPGRLVRLPGAVLSAIPAAVVARIPATALSAVPAADLSRLPVAFVSRLSGSALAGLPASVLARMPAGTLTALLPRLPGTTLAQLPRRELAGLLARLPRRVGRRDPGQAAGRVAEPDPAEAACLDGVRAAQVPAGRPALVAAVAAPVSR